MGEPATGLIPFMGARLDEDEAAAKAATGAPWKCEVIYRGTDHAEWIVVGHTGSQAIIAGDLGVGWMAGLPHDGEHIALHDPNRELREVAAKRARLALMIEAVEEMDKIVADDDARLSDQTMAIGRARAAITAVRHDATVWSNHPDYREKWAPERGGSDGRQ